MHPSDERVPASYGVVADLALQLPALPHRTTVPAVDRMFRQDPGLRAVAVRRSATAHPVLLSRSRLSAQLSGPYGYGRALYERRTVSALAPAQSLVLPADLALPLAAQAVLARDVEDRYEDVVVRWADGTLGLLPVAALFERLTNVFQALAMHDALTGLPNRTRLEQVAARDGGARAGTTLLYVDLDGFKHVKRPARALARGRAQLAGRGQRLPDPAERTDIVEDVGRALAESGLPAVRLQLEITESAAIKDLPSTARTLRDIRALGVRLALDDFGTGYSSLSLLRELPLDELKIDRSFVQRVDSDRADSRLVALAVAAAHEYGLVAVAEGVERVEQLETLADLGCDQVQGFLLGRPAAEAHPGSAVRRPHLRAVLAGVRRSSDELAGHA